MRKHPFYPFLLAVNAVLVLLYANIDEVNMWISARIIPIILLMAGMVLAISYLIRRDIHRAAAFAGLAILFWNLGYGLRWWSLAFIPLLILVVVVENVKPVTYWANLTTGIQFVILIILIVAHAGARDWPFKRNNAHAAYPNQPDVYFIVLDSYTSHKVLLDRFDYDNSDFIDALSGLGFDAGACRTPAAKTDLSLSAMLNGHPFEESDELWRYIRNSAVRQDLEGKGYLTYAFATGFVWDEIIDADVFIRPELPWTDPNVFEVFYLRQTPLGWLRPFGLVLDEDWGAVSRMYTRSVLDNLEAMPGRPGPKFVFAHILTPHPPFVFTADGGAADWQSLKSPHPRGEPEYTPEDYAIGYIGQVEFISNAILPVVKHLVEDSPIPPTIYLIGDHGPWFSGDVQGQSALCATYGPGNAIIHLVRIEE
jgi:hypothetical protein